MIIEIQPKERRPAATLIQGNSSICSAKNAVINDRGSWKGLVRNWSLNEIKVDMTYKHYGDDGEHHQRSALTRCLYRLLEYELALGRAYLGLFTREFRFLYAGKLLYEIKRIRKLQRVSSCTTRGYGSADSYRLVCTIGVLSQPLHLGLIVVYRAQRP